MPVPFHNLPPAVAAPLRAYARRRSLYRALRLLCIVLAVELILALGVMHLDRLLFLAPQTRLALTWATHAAALLTALAGLILYACRRPTPRRLAYELESRLPGDAHEQFVTLEALSAHPNDDAGPVRADLRGHLEHAASRYSQGVAGGRLVRDRALRIAAATTLLLLFSYLALLLPATYQFPLMLERFAFPTRPLPKPSFVTIHTSPGGAVIGRGGEFTVQAEITDGIPPALAWLYQRLGMDASNCLIAIDDGPWLEMARTQRTFYIHTLQDLQQSFTYRLRCGDAQTTPRQVTVVTQPRITALSVTTAPPAYTGLERATIQRPTEPLMLLPGTHVHLAFTTDQPVPIRQLIADNEADPIAPEWNETTRTGTYAFSVTSPLHLELRVENKHGFANIEQAEVTIGLREDQPPGVRLLGTATTIERLPGDIVPLRIELIDDFGLNAAAIRYQLNPDQATEAAYQELPLKLPEPGAPQATIATAFDLDATGAVPGDELLLIVRARDSAGNDSLGRPLTIRIVAFTRGENERRRLQVLRLLHHQLREHGLHPHYEADAWDSIRQAAEDANLGLAEAPQLTSLLQLIAREHHFTDDPRHKRDLRLLSGTLANHHAPAIDLIPPLTAYRHLKNLTWRLYGMRHEADAIRQRLQALANTDTPDEDEARMLKRRAALYLNTLQDIGDELLALARATDHLSEDTIGPIQGDLNTAAYYLRRGSLARNLESATAIIASLDAILQLLRPALEPLRQQEAAARQELQSTWLQALNEAPPAWRDDQQNLLELNPFATFPEYLQLLTPHDPWHPYIDDARQRQRHLADTWQLAHLDALTRISDEERLLAAELIHNERPTPTTSDPLPALDDQIRESAILDGWQDNLDALIASLSPIPDTPDTVPQLVDLVRGTPRQLESIVDRLALRLRYLDPLAPQVARDERLLLQLRAALNRYNLAIAPGLANLPATPGAEPTDEELNQILLDLPRLTVPLRALHTILAKSWSERQAETPPTDGPTYPMLDTYAKTRAYLTFARRLAQNDDPAAIATDFLHAFPDARLDHLASQLPHIDRAHQQLRKAADALAAQPPQPTTASTALAAGRAALATFRAALQANDPLAPAITELQNRAQRLTLTPDAPPLAIREARYALGELLTAIQRLQRELRAETTAATDTSDGFRGGPPGIWEEPFRRDAEHARQRLLDQLALARRRITLGLLDGLDGQLAPDTQRHTLAWATFYHAVVRSELGGPVRMRPRQRQQDQAGNRLADWLLQQLHDARTAARTADHLAPYQGLTLEYLDSMADYLRY